MKQLSLRHRLFECRNGAPVEETGPRTLPSGENIEVLDRSRLELAIHTTNLGPYSRDSLDRMALEVRRRAKLEPREVRPASIPIARIMGPDAYIERVNFLSEGTMGPSETTKCGFQIVVDSNHPDKTFIGYHELAHYILEEDGYTERGEECERIADYLAAATMGPADAVRNIYRHCGENFPKAAAAFFSTESYVVLRYAEVLQDHRALVYEDLAVRLPNRGILPANADALQRLARGPSALLKTRGLTGPYDIGRRAYWLDPKRRPRSA